MDIILALVHHFGSQKTRSRERKRERERNSYKLQTLDLSLEDQGSAQKKKKERNFLINRSTNKTKQEAWKWKNGHLTLPVSWKRRCRSHIVLWHRHHELRHWIVVCHGSEPWPSQARRENRHCYALVMLKRSLILVGLVAVQKRWSKSLLLLTEMRALGWDAPAKGSHRGWWAWRLERTS